MYNLSLFRVSQLLLILPCLMREWINFLTDIEQFQNTTQLAYKIISYPTQDKINSAFERSVDSMTVAKVISFTWICIHLLVGIIISYGFIRLLTNLRSDNREFTQAKQSCFLGLSLGIFFYVLILGFFSMDYFLSWMQHISYNGDIAGYCLPLIAALLYLTVNESPIEH